VPSLRERDPERAPRAHNDINTLSLGELLTLDDTAKRNLELFATTQGTAREALPRLRRDHDRHGGPQAALVAVLPLLDAAKIRQSFRPSTRSARLTSCARICARPSRGFMTWSAWAGALPSVSPTAGTGCPARLAARAAGLKAAPDALETSVLTALREGIDEMPEILDLLERSIAAEPPLTLRGGIIREGYDAELDGSSLFRATGSLDRRPRGEGRHRTGIASLRWASTTCSVTTSR